MKAEPFFDRFGRYWGNFSSMTLHGYTLRGGAHLVWIISVASLAVILCIRPLETILFIALAALGSFSVCIAGAAVAPIACTVARSLRIQGLKTHRLVVIFYAIFVLLSLAYSPWRGWSGGYHPVTKQVMGSIREEIRYSPFYQPPSGLYGAAPTGYKASVNVRPILMFRELMLVWSALGIVTISVVWLTVRQSTNMLSGSDNPANSRVGEI